MFIWIDLRHLLIPKSSDYSALRVTSPDPSIYKQRELRIADICAGNGVMIAPGNVYVPEEFGWFRITYTVEKEALEEGLCRLWKSIAEVQVEIEHY